MSDANLPEIPSANEEKRATPLARYLTQQLTRLVPQPRAAVEGDAPRSWWTDRRRRWSLAIGAGLVLILIVGLVGSGETEATPAGFATSDDSSASWLDSQIDAWRASKLEPGGFAEVDASTLGALSCHGGAASAIEITLCRYSSAAGAAAAVSTAESSIGSHTGVVVTDGERLLVVADRRSADPSGRTINRIVKAFAD